LAKANKNSATSSTPPSSDITNPPPKRGKPGRPRRPKIGRHAGVFGDVSRWAFATVSTHNRGKRWAVNRV
ncbi:unnamed protein product, partial [Laminaria digitata]